MSGVEPPTESAKGQSLIWRNKEDDIVNWFMKNNYVIEIAHYDRQERQERLKVILEKMDKDYEYNRCWRIKLELARRALQSESESESEPESIELMKRRHFDELESKYKRLYSDSTRSMRLVISYVRPGI